MPAPRRAFPLVAVLLALLVLAGCGGSDEAEGPSPKEVMAKAKKAFDDSPSVKLALSTDSVPASGQAVLGATGDLSHAPAFKGTVKVVLNGLTATVPVTAVDGKVFAKLPFGGAGEQEINPAEFGAPDPADFASPETGLSALLTDLTGVKKGEERRDGDTILTSYSGSLPGASVKRTIPSADESATYKTRVGIDQDGRAVTVRITGAFFAGEDDTTYDVKLSGYGEDVTITAPTS